MQALFLLRRSSLHRVLSRTPTPPHLHPNPLSHLHRAFSTDDHFKRPRGSTPAPNKHQVEDADEIFSEENVRDLTSGDIARLRVIYGLVKEHIKAAEQNKDPVDLESNPLLDPRSFDIKRIPNLPSKLLELFRKDLPSEIAANSRPVSTHGIWDGVQGSERQAALSAEHDTKHADEWAAVDERTMDPRNFARMQRQSLAPSSDVAYKGESKWIWSQRKKKCPLKDEKGRVHVDFRAVGSLAPYVSENGKILPKRKSGLSAKAQRRVAKAVKTARQMALLHPEPNPMPTYEELLELERSLP